MNIPTGISTNWAIIFGVIIVIVVGGIIAAVVLIPSSAKKGDGPPQRLGSSAGPERQDAE